MTRVFVVTTGEYSDYHIVGIYSTEELAERMKTLYLGSVEAWTVDKTPPYPAGRLPFIVRMDREGNSTVERAPYGEEASRREPPFRERWAPYGDGVHAYFAMWAADEQHAVKIANERRAELIANGNWTLDHAAWVKAGRP